MSVAAVVLVVLIVAGLVHRKSNVNNKESTEGFESISLSSLHTQDVSLGSAEV